MFSPSKVSRPRRSKATSKASAVPATNPFNPFGEPVVFRYRVTELGARIDEVETDFYRGIAGVNLHLGEQLGI